MIRHGCSIESILTRVLGRRNARLHKESNYRDAAVLVPLVPMPDGTYHVLFEERAHDIVWQPGDVCFPGGREEEQDISFADTAVRETCEELGLETEDITLLGALDFYFAHWGMMVYPYVGVVNNLQRAKIDKSELACYFTIPLEKLLTMEPLVSEIEMAAKGADNFPFDLVPSVPREWKVQKGRITYFYQWEKHVIWGLTARILHSFLEILKKEEARILKAQDGRKA